MDKHQFDYATLDAYRLALEVARWMRRVRWPQPNYGLRDHGTRAADSTVLNIAEGRMRGGKAGRNHFRIALGSAGEAAAVLDLVDLPDGRLNHEKLRRVGAMLHRMR